MKTNNKNRSSFRGMTLPELTMSILMMIIFTNVFVLVSQFIAKFFQPMNLQANTEIQDILKDHSQLHQDFDTYVEFLSQPAISKTKIISLKCTSDPKSDWDIPLPEEEDEVKSKEKKILYTKYRICISSTILIESSYEDFIYKRTSARPGIYVLFAIPVYGTSYSEKPIRRVFCRPRTFC
tara:strand:+ start:15712 stop:16251 length:540 start_codon:yes stop_codon:yes gene_type:complete